MMCCIKVLILNHEKSIYQTFEYITNDFKSLESTIEIIRNHIKQNHVKIFDIIEFYFIDQIDVNTKDYQVFNDLIIYDYFVYEEDFSTTNNEWSMSGDKID